MAVSPFKTLSICLLMFLFVCFPFVVCLSFPSDFCSGVAVFIFFLFFLICLCCFACFSFAPVCVDKQ